MVFLVSINFTHSFEKENKKKNYKFFYHIQKLEVCHSASFTAPWGREFAVASATNENPVYINARERELPISKKITPYGSTNKNVKSWEPTSRIMDFHKKKACSYRWCFLNIGTWHIFPLVLDFVHKSFSLNECRCPCFPSLGFLIFLEAFNLSHFTSSVLSTETSKFNLCFHSDSPS